MKNKCLQCKYSGESHISGSCEGCVNHSHFCAKTQHNKQFLQTYEWLKSKWLNLIKIQEENGIVLDENSQICGKLGIDEEKHMIFEYGYDTNCRSIYYGDGWTDEEMETKQYWKLKLRHWRIVRPENFEKINWK